MTNNAPSEEAFVRLVRRVAELEDGAHDSTEELIRVGHDVHDLKKRRVRIELAWVVAVVTTLIAIVSVTAQIVG